MSITFTKLFSSITESTIWVESDATRIVWIAMLAMADRKGRVWASIPGLASRARVSLEQAESAIKKFLEPDTYSRTKLYEGKRIEKIDGGWRLLNHGKYRAIRDDEAIKESKRNYINTRRAKERVENISTVDRSRHNAEAEAFKTNTKLPCASDDLFDSFWTSYPKKRNKGDARKAWKALKPIPSLVDKILSALTSAKKSKDWIKEDGKYIPYPASWLRSEGWDDELENAVKEKSSLEKLYDVGELKYV